MRPNPAHRRRAIRRGAVAGGLIAVIAACAGAPTVVDLPTGGIDRSDFYGTFPVVVLGDPFPGVDHGVLTRRVVDAMPRGLGLNLDFDAAGALGPTERRVVWVFGPVAGGDVSAVCQSRGGGPQSGQLRVYAAVCRGPSAVAAVQAEIGGVDTSDDPGFARLIRAAALELFATPSTRRRNTDATEPRPAPALLAGAAP
jgi:hypothetical protein